MRFFVLIVLFSIAGCETELTVNSTNEDIGISDSAIDSAQVRDDMTAKSQADVSTETDQRIDEDMNGAVDAVADQADQANDMDDRPSRCDGLTTSKDALAIPRLEKPTPLQRFAEPTFGTDVVRISNAAAGAVVKPLYNSVQGWNADESMLMLYHTGVGGQGHHIYNGKTYEYMKQVDIVPTDLEEVYWDTQNPDIFYYISKRFDRLGHLLRYNVSTDVQELVHDFTGECPGNGIPMGGSDIQMTSWDSDLIGLRCPNAPRTTFFYRISTDTVSSKIPLGDGTPYQDWYAISPAASGDRFVMQGDVLDSNLDFVRALDVVRYSDGTFKPEHAVLGKMANGNDAYFVSNYDVTLEECDGGISKGTGFLVSYDIETGECRSVVGENTGWGYPHSGTHPASLGYDTPGFVAVSSIGYGKFEFFENNQPAPALLSELFLVDTNAPDESAVCRIAHVRTTGKDAANGGYPGYFGEPHPVLSPSGTRVLFGSDWYDSGSVDTYVVELPTYIP